MLPEINKSNPQLFVFSVLGLPELTLAVPLFQVIAVATLERSRSVPFAPSFVVGINSWQGEVITVIDMATALCREHAIQSSHETSTSYLIALTVANQHQEMIAWPILPGAHTIELPQKVPRSELPGHISSTLTHAAITVNERPHILINLASLIPAVPA